MRPTSLVTVGCLASRPAMNLVQVADLVEDRALVEIEVTAVVPDSSP